MQGMHQALETVSKFIGVTLELPLSQLRGALHEQNGKAKVREHQQGHRTWLKAVHWTAEMLARRLV
jgi:hypothetical protein